MDAAAAATSKGLPTGWTAKQSKGGHNNAGKTVTGRDAFGDPVGVSGKFNAARQASDSAA